MTDHHHAPHIVQMLAEIDASYTRSNAFLDTLSEEQFTIPTDAGGWTVKDHVMHLAVWAGSMLAVIDKQARWEAMGLSLTVWETIEETYDQINAAIQQQHRNKPLSAVRSEFNSAHQAVVERVKMMTTEALDRPYAEYQPWAVDETDPLYAYIHGNTADHYDEHQQYIKAIVEQGI